MDTRLLLNFKREINDAINDVLYQPMTHDKINRELLHKQIDCWEKWKVIIENRQNKYGGNKSDEESVEDTDEDNDNGLDFDMFDSDENGRVLSEEEDYTHVMHNRIHVNPMNVVHKNEPIVHSDYGAIGSDSFNNFNAQNKVLGIDKPPSSTIHHSSSGLNYHNYNNYSNDFDYDSSNRYRFGRSPYITHSTYGMYGTPTYHHRQRSTEFDKLADMNEVPGNFAENNTKTTINPFVSDPDMDVAEAADEASSSSNLNYVDYSEITI